MPASDSCWTPHSHENVQLLGSVMHTHCASPLGMDWHDDADGGKENDNDDDKMLVVAFSLSILSGGRGRH